jgi:hypothetical protein
MIDTSKLERIETYGGDLYAYRDPASLVLYAVRPCAVCKGEILLASARSWRQRYCSKPCSQKAANEKARVRRKQIREEMLAEEAEVAEANK